MDFEKFDPKTREGFSWTEGMSLGELLKRRKEIVDLATKRRDTNDDRSWQEKLVEEGDPTNLGCLICSL